MRVLAIRGRNLASLAGDFEVDFEAPPLADAGIFAITGPTGAGKSTLLDAMCLALFDTVPRLGAASRGRIENDQGDELSATDPRTILRHGESDAFAEIDFVARDANRYRARWTVQRARMKPTGRLKSSVQTLLRIDTGERLGGTKTETLGVIHQLVGLSAEQFRRAVLLAQGDFEAFIKANDNDRAVLLERITGSRIYTTLGRAAFEKASALRLVQQGLIERLQSQQVLDDAARTAAEEHRAAAETDERLADAAVADLEKAARWETDHAMLNARLAACETEVARAAAAFGAAEPDREALRRSKSAFTLAQDWAGLAGARVAAEDAGVEAAGRIVLADSAAVALADIEGAERVARAAVDAAIERAAAFRPLLDEAKTVDRRIVETASTLDDLSASRAERAAAAITCGAAVITASAALEGAVATRDRHGSWLAEHAGLASLSAREVELAQVLADRATAALAIVALEADEIATRSGLVVAEDSYSGTELAAAEASAALLLKQDQLLAAEAAVPDEAIRTALFARRDAVAGLRPLLVDWRAKSATWSESEARLARLVAEGDDAAKELSRLSEKRASVVETLPGLRLRLEEARRAGDIAEAAAAETAMRLRALLVAGQPCPVCGATEHSAAAIDRLIGEHLEGQRRRIAALESDVANGAAEDVRLGTEVEGLLRQGSARTAEEARLRAQAALQVQARDDAHAILTGSAGTLGFDVEDEAFETDVTSTLSIIDAERRSIDAAIETCGVARSSEAAARKVRDDARSAFEVAATNRRAAADGAAQAKAGLERGRAEIERLERAVDFAFDGVVEWRRVDDPIAWLAQRCSAWRTRTSEHAEALAAVPGLEAALGEIRTAYATAAALAAAVEGEASKLTTALELLDEKRTTMLDGRSVAEVEAEVGERLMSARGDHDAAGMALADARQSWSAAVARREGASSALLKAEDALDRLGRAFDVRLAELSLNAEEVAAAIAEGPGRIEAEEWRLADLASAVRDADVSIAQRRVDLNQHESGDRPAVTGEALQTALAAARLALSGARSVLGNATFVLLRDDDARARTADLRAELERERESSRVWLALGDLIGDKEGRTFRRFAQGLTLDRLLSHANERLLDLKPRFALERGTGGDMLIQVVDHDMAGEVRGVHNLSGGERFLISLALALGLAEMSTGRGLRIESLFIDEGFGALDTSSLGQAIGVLEHLHATGRRVGVISHVEEVKERIPVKIEVVPVSRGRSVLSVSTN